MSPVGLNMVNDALNLPAAAAAQEQRLHICRADGGKEAASITWMRTPKDAPIWKSMLHTASVCWSHDFNLNSAETWRCMNYFLVVMKAIKKDKLITSGLKLATQ